MTDVLRAFPHLGANDCVSTSMGCNGEDVRLSPLARAALPLSIEAKNQEKLNIWQSLEQAASNTSPDSTPCVVFSRNNAPTWAVVPWPELLRLYAARDASRVPARLQALVNELAGWAAASSPAHECASASEPGASLTDDKDASCSESQASEE